MDDGLRREIDELRASRARVVAGADNERRRIERGLHDGVQQHLVALAVNLQLAQELADSDPAALKTLLGEMGQDVRDALESVRAIAQSVYPPLLLDYGVAEALRGAAAGIGIGARVEAELAGRYPPEVEATAYFCCVAALQNAAENAGPETEAAVRMWADEDALRFEVALDGSETEPDEACLTDMHDRLGAVGGRLDISPGPGRTSLVGTIPLRK
jgi:signal transduction histidine kinase